MEFFILKDSISIKEPFFQICHISRKSEPKLKNQLFFFFHGLKVLKLKILKKNSTILFITELT